MSLWPHFLAHSVDRTLNVIAADIVDDVVGNSEHFERRNNPGISRLKHSTLHCHVPQALLGSHHRPTTEIPSVPDPVSAIYASSFNRATLC